MAKKRTLIERLKEKRTALISRTVTRGLPPDAARRAGLDPHPKLKPSGIDGIGDVPQEWEYRSPSIVARPKSDCIAESILRKRATEGEVPVFFGDADILRMGYIDYWQLTAATLRKLTR